jgi:hypothetical protein
MSLLCPPNIHQQVTTALLVIITVKQYYSRLVCFKSSYKTVCYTAFSCNLDWLELRFVGGCFGIFGTGGEGVAGSNPAVPTIQINELGRFLAAFFMSVRKLQQIASS